jgi:hypothetical protein
LPRWDPSPSPAGAGRGYLLHSPCRVSGTDAPPCEQDRHITVGKEEEKRWGQARCGGVHRRCRRGAGRGCLLHSSPPCGRDRRGARGKWRLELEQPHWPGVFVHMIEADDRPIAIAQPLARGSTYPVGHGP